MKQKTKFGAVFLSIIVAVAGGSYAFDFSQTTTIIDTETTNIEGDTIFNLPSEDEIADAILERICNLDIIPEEYQAVCEERK